MVNLFQFPVIKVCHIFSFKCRYFYQALEFQVSNATWNAVAIQLNDEPVWAGSAALFASSITLYPGNNRVTFNLMCGGKTY